MCKARGTAAQVELRVEMVADLMVRGKTRAEICKYVRENIDPSLSTSQIDRYVSKAKNALRERAEERVDVRRATVEQRLELVFATAVDKGDLRAALSATKQYIELFALGVTSEQKDSDLLSYQEAIRAYADILRQTIPPDLLRQVIAKAEEVAVVSQALEENIDEALERCVKDVRELGRPKTYDELCSEGYR